METKDFVTQFPGGFKYPEPVIFAGMSCRVIAVAPAGCEKNPGEVPIMQDGHRGIMWRRPEELQKL